MQDVLGIAWRYGRCCHEGYVVLQMAVYLDHGGTRGSTEVRMLGVPRKRGATRVPYSGSATGSHGSNGVSP